MNEYIAKVLERNKEEYLNYLIDLVEIDTQHIGQGIEGGNEYEGQKYLAKLAEKIGATEITFDPMDEKFISEGIDNFQEGNPNHNYDKRDNLYVSFENHEKYPTLMFNGHVDTVTPGALEMWDTPPLEAVIKNEKLIGLGTADMKAGLIASFLAVKLLKDSDIDFNTNVVITSVVDEEGGGNGSIQAALNGPKADAVVVCEGTNYELILAHMGFVFFKVDVEGKANHSGEKWKGIDAIEKTNKIIADLKLLEYDWLFEYKHDLLPPPNINFGVIRGGSSGATVPGHCTIEFCIHYHPNTMSHNFIKEQITNQINRTAKGDKWLKENLPAVEIFQAGGPYEMEEDTLTVSTFKKTYFDVFGKNVKIVGSPAGCDSRIWKNIAGIDTIQYGPGRLEECHSANEYVRIEEFLDSILVYANLILNYEGIDKNE